MNRLFLAPMALLLVFSAAWAEEKSWPEKNPEAKAPEKQLDKGPGGTEYRHAEYEVTERGEDGKHYWLYTPAKPKTDKAPLICFLHGWGGIKPEVYLQWLVHLCRRGNIVIYPQYQANLKELAPNYPVNAAWAVLDALEYLEADKSRVQPLRDKFALAGHSAGAVCAANMASEWEKHKLPKPGACMAIQPGSIEGLKELLKKADPEWLQFKNVPEGCLLLSIYGDSDNVAGWWLARKVFMDAKKVKEADKNLIEFRSDIYGETPLVADHYTPVSSGERALNVIDWFGYWKLLDGLTDAAFHGKNREYALGDTEQQRDMGKWSDGKPIRTLKVWLGNESVDPDEAFQPLYNKDGTPWSKEERKPRFPKRGEKGEKDGK
jgi:acetyl esterase/lipase